MLMLPLSLVRHRLVVYCVQPATGHNVYRVHCKSRPDFKHCNFSSCWNKNVVTDAKFVRVT